MEPNQNKNEIKNASKNNRMTLSFDLRLIVLLLVAVIVIMLFMWHPWINTNLDAKNQIITVTGETTIKAVPDGFVFSPSYDFVDKDKTKALAALTKKSDDLTTKLENLGVTKDQIKTNSTGYNYYGYYYDPTSNQNTYSLQLTVTVNDQASAQKV